eukprot:916071-Rhodomonas_salina.1
MGAACRARPGDGKLQVQGHGVMSFNGKLTMMRRLGCSSRPYVLVQLQADSQRQRPQTAFCPSG